MRRKEQSPQESEQTSKGALLQVASLGIAIFLSVVVLAVAVAQANNVAPEIGDIVAFKPGTDVPRPLRVDVQARVLDPKAGRPQTCVLEPEIIAVDGGSLVVEARQTADSAGYIVHWAGHRTSQGADDCGRAADLVLNDLDLEHLARTAGGFGVDPKSFTPSLPILAGVPVVVN